MDGRSQQHLPADYSPSKMSGVQRSSRPARGRVPPKRPGKGERKIGSSELQPVSGSRVRREPAVSGKGQTAAESESSCFKISYNSILETIEAILQQAKDEMTNRQPFPQAITVPGGNPAHQLPRRGLAQQLRVSDPNTPSIQSAGASSRQHGREGTVAPTPQPPALSSRVQSIHSLQRAKYCSSTGSPTSCPTQPPYHAMTDDSPTEGRSVGCYKERSPEADMQSNHRIRQSRPRERENCSPRRLTLYRCCSHREQQWEDVREVRPDWRESRSRSRRSPPHNAEVSRHLYRPQPSPHRGGHPCSGLDAFVRRSRQNGQPSVSPTAVPSTKTYERTENQRREDSQVANELPETNHRYVNASTSMAVDRDLRTANATASMADKGYGTSAIASSNLASVDRPTCKKTSEAAYHPFVNIRESDGTNQQTSGADSSPVGGGDRTVKSGVKQVWIVGHSYVYWAEKQAVARNYGAQLGIPYEAAKLTWLGKIGMVWEDIRGELLKAEARHGKPDVLITHLGGSDLGKTKSLDLIRCIRQDMQWVVDRWRAVIVIWSNIIPRMAWEGVSRGAGVERARKKINAAMAKVIPPLGGRCIQHTVIKGNCTGYYREDGAHLSDVATDLFNITLQEAVEAVVFPVATG
ncbi:uncharacterized protein LOC134969669 [Pseudophryne corroboree]|uniref:uncharacterized protein LOC134969669 n=1 Tax=Pseudophryne corroboree TaxID=495146 RepID=UPI003081AA55